MIVKIKDKALPAVAISELLVTGDWNSLYTKGRIVLNTNNLLGKDLVDDSIRIGTSVDIYFEDSSVVYLKILAFNFLQELEGVSKTAGDLLELILVSPWYLDSSIKNTVRYGTSSQIIRSVLEEDFNIDSLDIEIMADPPRKRYQLGINNFEFLETLRPYLSTAKSMGLLYNGIYGKDFKLVTFSSLKEAASLSTLRAPGSNAESDHLEPALSDCKFYYNENKKITDTYLVGELVTELCIESNSTSRVMLPTNTEILSDLENTYVYEMDHLQWELSPAEQEVMFTRKKYLAEATFNKGVVIIAGINLIFNIGSKLTLIFNKPDRIRDNIMGNEYIIESITFSMSAENDEAYTKMVVIPLLNLD